MARQTIKRLVSFWLAVAALFCFTLQLVPFLPYILPLPLLYLTGPLIQATLIVVFIESILGRMPRYIAAVPALIYGAYFGVVLYERVIVLPALVSEARAANISTIPFDPARQSLRINGALNSRLLVVRYSIPRVLLSDATAIVLATPERCPTDVNVLRDIQRGPLIVVGDGERTYCVENVDVTVPSSGIVSITKQPGEIVQSPVRQYVEAITFELDGQTLGTFRSVRTNVLKLLPEFGAGCGVLDMPAAWQCGIQLGREEVAISEIPDVGDGTLPYRGRLDPQITYIAGILGLVLRSDTQLQEMAMSTE